MGRLCWRYGWVLGPGLSIQAAVWEAEMAVGDILFAIEAVVGLQYWTAVSVWSGDQVIYALVNYRAVVRGGCRLQADLIRSCCGIPE